MTNILLSDIPKYIFTDIRYINIILLIFHNQASPRGPVYMVFLSKIICDLQLHNLILKHNALHIYNTKITFKIL